MSNNDEDIEKAFPGFDASRYRNPITEAKGAEMEAGNKLEYDKSIHSNPSADAWTDFFLTHYPTADKDMIRGWFANVMMAMHDHIYQTKDVREKPTPPIAGQKSVEANPLDSERVNAFIKKLDEPDRATFNALIKSAQYHLSQKVRELQIECNMLREGNKDIAQRYHKLRFHLSEAGITHPKELKEFMGLVEDVVLGHSYQPFALKEAYAKLTGKTT